MITDKKYSIEQYTKDALASQYEQKANRMIRTVLDDGRIIIGKNRYDALKKVPQDKLIRNQSQEVKDFEDYHGITEYVQKLIEQEKIRNAKLEEEEKRKRDIAASINKKSVWLLFKSVYKKTYGVEFEETEDTLANVGPVIKYFARDKSFLNHGAKVNGKFLSQPSFDKGLLIVGGFGNGKTSIMTTIQKLFIGVEGFSFGRFSAHEIVQKYEEASKHNHPEVLENFWDILTRSELYIDDVKAESIALAYGKKNVLNSLFQERYNKRLKTHISINYLEGANGDVFKALTEFKVKYSNQVYDRIYEMYNIIEFKGKSFRR